MFVCRQGSGISADKVLGYSLVVQQTNEHNCQRCELKSLDHQAATLGLLSKVLRNCSAAYMR